MPPSQDAFITHAHSAPEKEEEEEEEGRKGTGRKEIKGARGKKKKEKSLLISLTPDRIFDQKQYTGRAKGV